MNKPHSVLGILKIPFLRNILVVSILIAAAVPVCDVMFIFPSFSKMLASSTEEEAVRVARSLKSMIIAGQEVLCRDSLSANALKTIKGVKNDFGLMKLKIFSSSGEVIYSTDPKEMGEMNPRAYFHDILAKGEIYTKFVKKDTKSLEGEKFTADVFETYIPILGERNEFRGAFEIYYDVSDRKETLDKLLLTSSIVLVLLPFALLGAMVVVLMSAGKNVARREQVEEELREHRNHLEELVFERTDELTTANVKLRQEVDFRTRAEEALRESERKLHLLSSHLLTAQERERRRLSLELHDEMGQTLTVLKLQLRSIEEKLKEDQQPLKGDCEETLEYVDQIIENVRRLSLDLSPSILEDLGLSAALRSLMEDSVRHFDLRISIEMGDIDDLFPLEAQIIIYRIFQEAFTNIGKHAEASHVSVVIKRDKDTVSFLIEDDGKGFDMQKVGTGDPFDKGLGLAAMGERARTVGGHLQIQSEQNKGTRIRFSVSVGKGGRG